MTMYKIEVKRVINGETIDTEVTKSINGKTFDTKEDAAREISDTILNKIECGEDSTFGNYRNELVNVGTPQEDYKFAWSCGADEDDVIADDNGWNIGTVGTVGKPNDTYLSFNIVEVPTISDYTHKRIKEFGKFFKGAWIDRAYYFLGGVVQPHDYLIEGADGQTIFNEEEYKADFVNMWENKLSDQMRLDIFKDVSGCETDQDVIDFFPPEKK